MKRYPNILRVESVVKMAGEVACGLPDGRYVPARPLAPSFWRWRATWLVFTGRADALLWTGQ
jgi:hypothetical protein